MALGVSLPVWWQLSAVSDRRAFLLAPTFMINGHGEHARTRAVAGRRATTLMAAMIAALGRGKLSARSWRPMSSVRLRRL